MCRADIAPEIHERLGALLADMGRALATLAGQPDGEVLIGPVDFGGATDG